MERTRRVDLRTQDIEQLLAESDIEDLTPSDEDVGDPLFDFQLENEPTTSSDDEETEKEDARFVSSVTNNHTRGPRGGKRSRGRGLRGFRNSRLSRQVDIGENLLSSPSTSGSKDLWIDENFPQKDFLLSEPSYIPTATDSFNKIDYFHQYINDEIINLIVEKTNQTAVKFTGKSLNFDLKECYIYVGITMIMATLNYPNLRMYWEKRWRVDIIAVHMSRNRFTQLRNSLQLVIDDDVATETRQKDKLWKVRPLIKRMQEGCRSQEKLNKLCIDEMIIPFTGTCGIKQYCPGKPNPEGLKVFVLANRDGLVCDFHVYEGHTTYPEYEKASFGFGEKAVLTLVDNLVTGHILYFDRYFTSEKLIDELLSRGIGCSGTIMKNRIPAASRHILLDDRDLKNRGRGSVQVLVRKDKKMALTKWYDDKAVTLLSSVEASEDMDVCNRWSKQERRYVLVNRPQVIRNYNLNMGGVDLADRLLAVCPYRYRTKKWTQRFISHMIDLAVTNAWVQYKKEKKKQNIPLKKIQQLRSFKTELGEYLLDSYALAEFAELDDLDIDAEPNETVKRKRGKPGAPLPSKKRRLHPVEHMPIFEVKESRCRHYHYKKSRVRCNTCNITLCFTSDRNCFLIFTRVR